MGITRDCLLILDFSQEAEGESIGCEISCASSTFLEMLRRRKSGTSMKLVVNTSMAMEEEGGPMALITPFVDATESEEVEGRLEERAEGQRLLLDNLNAQVWSVTEPGTYGAVNQPMADLLGLEKERVEGQGIADLREGKAAKIWIDGNRMAFEEKIPIGTEEWLKGPDGRFRIMDTTKVPLLNERGEVEYVICTAIEVTDKPEAEALSTRLGRILDRSVNEIYLFDAETLRFVQTNSAGLRNLGYSIEELREMTPLDLKRSMSPEEFMSLLASLKEGLKDEVVFETVHRRKDGSEYDVEVHLQLMREEKPPMYVAILMDVTERRRMTEALRIADRKIGLIGKVTRHDMLNHLSVIKGYAGLLSNGLSDQGLGRYLDRIEQAANRMEQQLIFQRDYEQMGTHKPIWIDLSELIGEVMGEFILGEVRVVVECQKLELFCDPMIERVMYNLMQNTLRHSGEVSQIRVSCDRGKENLALIYEDDGAGISREKKEKIFEYGFGKGIGHGLFLVREMLAVDGMSITENGEEGKGARFEILIPSSRFRFQG